VVGVKGEFKAGRVIILFPIFHELSILPFVYFHIYLNTKPPNNET